MDAESLVLQFDDDFRIEMEIVGHLREVDAAEGVEIVGAVAGVEFGKVQTERTVLKERKDLVADELIERHAALQRAAEVLHHARAEYGIGLPGHQRVVHVGENLRRILAVTVEQDHDIEALVHEVLVAENLIAAIAPVLLVLEDLQLRVRVHLQVAKREFKRFVLAGVIKNHHLLNVLPHHVGNAAEDLGQCSGRIVGNDEDADPFAARVGELRRSGRIFGRGVHRRFPVHDNAEKRLDRKRRCAKYLAWRC